MLAILPEAVLIVTDDIYLSYIYLSLLFYIDKYIYILALKLNVIIGF